jgi:hypothetical protein
MDANEVLEYVKAAAKAVDLPLDDAAAQRVAQHLARTAALARQLNEFPLMAQDEQPECFQPAPWRRVGDGE